MDLPSGIGRMAIYPVDAIKVSDSLAASDDSTNPLTHSLPLRLPQTKFQQRVLSGQEGRPFGEQLSRLVRGPDPANPKPLLVGMSRLYRG